MKSPKKIVLGRLCIVFSIIFSIYAFFPIVNIDDRNRDNSLALKSAESSSGRSYIEFNKQHAYNGYSNDYIKWEIDGWPAYVDVIVLVMDSSDYYNFTRHIFNDGLALTVNSGYYGFKLSEGESKASGSYLVPYSDTWYIVFVNLDNDQEKTWLDFDVEWVYNTSYDYSFFGNFSASPMIFIGVFSLIAFFIVCGVASSSSYKRKSVLTKNDNPYIYKSAESKFQASTSINTTQNQELLKSEKIEQIYCMYCGEKLDKGSVFCSQCGSKL